MLANIELVVLSFLASLGFAVVFQIEKKDLILAGLGGTVTRIFYLIFMAFISDRVLFVALAAFVAALYAEIVSAVKHVPATYFLYPSIVPLIPGDLFYYMCVGIITRDMATFQQYGWSCLLSLVGMSVGFVICSCVSNYVRIRNLASKTQG